LRNGRNSGYQAINLAVHLGAAQIILLGYDMQFGRRGEHHWFGPHPSRVPPPVDLFLRHFPTLVKPLQQRGVSVVNCSPSTALTCFPRRPLRDELLERAA
jgi:hypothetical protein